MVSRRDYNAEMVTAARSVLIELSNLLGAFRDQIVVVGGWVPELLMPGGHVGSTDVDLALDHRHLDEGSYRTIRELLLGCDYRQGKQPFIYHRPMRIGGKDAQVQVDLLAGEYEGTGHRHRHQDAGGVQARKARGCDLAFEGTVELTLTGTLPGGAEDTARVRVASIVPFIVMKAFAMRDRLKEKDAWDIYYCLSSRRAQIDDLVAEFRPLRNHGLVREALALLDEKFASERHVGPKSVADFEELADQDDRALRQREAFELMHRLLSRLGVRGP
ncbi:MAG: hypothetical protein A2289_20495 [Deltaproteobacteria bacterium RIFOXYA12_FULL_58_15]|nr:MAG: hypothetical protein A2289_20495 [Deltaproteobacteria bacterium RIFOXYA12_FULL_58_15]OGR14065.1 MAG: hypothetical protein A2341_19205 [Deltaproteobacteria bacterium RIFOXYB12_FULL_58_9]